MSRCDEDGCVVRIRGLPWSATEENILKFFGDDVRVLNGGRSVHLTLSRDGRPSGEAYVELESEADVEAARNKHKCMMGQRYIEVFRSKRSEMVWVLDRCGRHDGSSDQVTEDGCVRLRGLPFGCSKEEVANFFSGLEVVPNGITLPMDGHGRSSGEAFVQFVSKEVAEKALLKNKERIGHRYIEIFRSSLNEVRQVQNSATVGRVRPLMMSRPTPYDRGDRWPAGGGGGGPGGPGGPGGRPAMFGRGGRRGGFNNDYDDYYDNGPAPPSWGRGPQGGPGGPRRGGGGSPGFGGGPGAGGPGGFHGGDPHSRPWRSSTGHTVHMRGLPFRSPETDVVEFFRPLVPVHVHMLFDDSGRPSGQANVDFATHDEAVQAMQKDKSYVGHRYIELFLNSTPASSYGDGGAVGNGGGGVGRGRRGDNFNGEAEDRFGGGYGDTGGYNGSSQMGGSNYNSFS